LANQKSDLLIEKELFDSYLVESKKILDDELAHLNDQILTLSKLKEIAPVRTRNKNLLMNEDNIEKAFATDNDTRVLNSKD